MSNSRISCHLPQAGPCSHPKIWGGFGEDLKLLSADLSSQGLAGGKNRGEQPRTVKTNGLNWFKCHDAAVPEDGQTEVEAVAAATGLVTPAKHNRWEFKEEKKKKKKR